MIIKYIFTIVSFLSFLLFGYGCYIYGYGNFKHDQRINIDDFVKTYEKYQTLKLYYSQYADNKQLSEYNLKQYVLQNLYFKHGLYIYKITGEIIRSSESIQMKKLIILQYNPVIKINERLNKINSLIDLYV